MAFCPHCGVKNDDDAAFCGGCGGSLSPVGTPAPAPAPKKKGSVGIIIIAIVVAVALIAAIAAGGWLLLGRGGSFGRHVSSSDSASLESGSAEALAEQFFGAVFSGNAKTALNLVPEEYIKYCCDREGTFKIKLIADATVGLKEMINELSDQYGTDWKVDMRVISSQDMEQADVDTLTSYYRDFYDVYMDVDAASQVSLELTLRADGVERTQEITFAVLKIGEKWYMEPDAISDAAVYFYAF